MRAHRGSGIALGDTQQTPHESIGRMFRMADDVPARDSGAERAMTNAFNAVTKVRRAVNERRGG